MNYNKLNLSIGVPKKYEVDAGSNTYSVIEIGRPNSIISVMFQTVEYDIQFGFYRAKDSESIY